MKLSELSADPKYLVAQELSGPDLVRLCATDQSMRQICATSKYNPIWIRLLKSDYNIDYNGNNGYMEYLQNTYFLNKPYYMIRFVFNESPDDEADDPILCRSKDEAYNRIKKYVDLEKSNIITDKSYIEIVKEIENNGYFKLQRNFSDIRIYLTEANFDTSPVEDYKTRYQSGLESIAEIIYPTDKEKREDFMNDFDDILDYVIDKNGRIDIDDVIENVNELLPDIPNKDIIPGEINMLLLDRY